MASIGTQSLSPLQQATQPAATAPASWADNSNIAAAGASAGNFDPSFLSSYIDPITGINYTSGQNTYTTAQQAQVQAQEQAQEQAYAANPTFSTYQQQQIQSSDDPALTAQLAEQDNQNYIGMDMGYGAGSLGAYDQANNVNINGENAAQTATTRNWDNTAAQNEANQAQSTLGQTDASINDTVSDLNSGNYGQAFNDAEMGKVNGGTNESINQDNPVLLDLMTSQGLNQLDPNATWNQANDTAYMNAMHASNPASLGVSSSGEWGNSPSASLAQQWVAQNGNEAPNLNASEGARPSQGNFIEKASPYINAAELAVITGGMGAALAPALGAVGAGAAAGATGAAGNDVMTGQAVTGGSLGKGALTGAIGGALAPVTSNITGALDNAGVNNTLAAGIGKGVVGAGTGALTAALHGGNAATGALVGGVGAGVSGAAGAASGNSTVGQYSGTIAGALANKYLTSPPTPSVPSTGTTSASTPATTPAASTPSTTAPATSTTAQAPSATPTPTPASSTTNIGSYPTQGLGFAPRTQVDPGITNYNTYGQGPEATFFAPTGTS
jgi:hypothetical protein